MCKLENAMACVFTNWQRPSLFAWQPAVWTCISVDWPASLDLFHLPHTDLRTQALTYSVLICLGPTISDRGLNWIRSNCGEAKVTHRSQCTEGRIGHTLFITTWGKPSSIWPIWTEVISQWQADTEFHFSSGWSDLTGGSLPSDCTMPHIPLTYNYILL